MFQEDKQLAVSNTVLAGAGRYRELAAAIRRGCKIRPKQIYCMEFDGEDGACAIGALMEGWDHNENSRKKILSSRMPDPFYPLLNRRLDAIIQDLNDESRWTRERIADWLDTLE